ncbi:MAG: TatD family hydrolase [Kiritimatiellae bacterium]|nr:TatD family hydrolase [Kiritimatiellia bacterium]
MTDAHCHVSCGDSSVRELLVGRDFFGVHPWDAVDVSFLPSLRAQLLANPAAGVGEIGLDRLKSRDISPRMREVFEAQLALALELGRPVVLHGAKCWGQVVTTVCRHLSHSPTPPLPHSPTPSFLFHGFSRSDGLIPEIVKLNGFISVGPAILNDHAVNYRELVKKIPLDRLLVETDRTSSSDSPSISDVLAKTADILNLSAAELERITDENADRFLGAV